MANSIITAIGDGTTTQYALNFTLGILRRSYVTCRVGSEVDGSGDPVYRTLEWVTDGLVNIQGDVPASGVPIVFQRTIPKTQLVHDYTDGVPIIESNLDESNLQNLMAVHEFLDGRLEAGFVQDLNMNNFKVTNVAVATSDGDAVNFGQMTDAIGDAPLFSANAAASAGAAAVSASNAASSESSAASLLAQVQAVYDDFDDRYLGEKATEPTVDNDGDPLETGALFFNTTENYLMVYSGSMWLALDLTIADGSITQAKLANNSVGTAQIIDANVTESKLATEAVSFLKLKTDNFISSLSEVLTTATNKIARISDLFDYVHTVGSVTQTKVVTKNTKDTTSVLLPADNTIPQNTEGKEYLTLDFTPKFASSKLLVEAFVPVVDNTGTSTFTLALFKDTDVNAFAAACTVHTNNTYLQQAQVVGYIDAGDTSTKTFKLRFGSSAGTATIGQTYNGGIELYDTVKNTILKVTEIKQ